MWYQSGSILKNGVIAKISDDELEEILGDSMVESLADHFVTIDKCEAVSECNGENCTRTINIPNLFKLKGEPPFDITILGLHTELAEKIELPYNLETKVFGQHIKLIAYAYV